MCLSRRPVFYGALIGMADILSYVFFTHYNLSIYYKYNNGPQSECINTVVIVRFDLVLSFISAPMCLIFALSMGL